MDFEGTMLGQIVLNANELCSDRWNLRQGFDDDLRLIFDRQIDYLLPQKWHYPEAWDVQRAYALT